MKPKKNEHFKLDFYLCRFIKVGDECNGCALYRKV